VATTRGLSADGIVDIRTGLKRLGESDDVFNTAARTAGQVVANQAKTFAPKRSGAMANSIAVDVSKAGYVVTAGSATIRYAYTFHAIALKRSKGGFTFTYPASKGRRAYSRRARIPDKPFLFQAAQVKRKAALDAYTKAVDQLLAKAAP